MHLDSGCVLKQVPPPRVEKEKTVRDPLPVHCGKGVVGVALQGYHNSISRQRAPLSPLSPHSLLTPHYNEFCEPRMYPLLIAVEQGDIETLRQWKVAGGEIVGH